MDRESFTEHEDVTTLLTTLSESVADVYRTLVPEHSYTSLYIALGITVLALIFCTLCLIFFCCGCGWWCCLDEDDLEIFH